MPPLTLFVLLAVKESCFYSPLFSEQIYGRKNFGEKGKGGNFVTSQRAKSLQLHFPFYLGIKEVLNYLLRGPKCRKNHAGCRVTSKKKSHYFTVASPKYCTIEALFHLQNASNCVNTAFSLIFWHKYAHKQSILCKTGMDVWKTEVPTRLFVRSQELLLSSPKNGRDLNPRTNERVWMLPLSAAASVS